MWRRRRRAGRAVDLNVRRRDEINSFKKLNIVFSYFFLLKKKHNLKLNEQTNLCLCFLKMNLQKGQYVKGSVCKLYIHTYAFFK